MFISKWTTSTLLMALVVLSCEMSETEEQWNTCVWVEVFFPQSPNSSETSCEAPGQPVYGGYVSDTHVDENRYNAGDKVQYYCHRGYQLIGQASRTCNGTLKAWQPDEPYCQPQYIGNLTIRLDGIEAEMRRLNDIEDRMKVIEQRIAAIENNTLSISQFDHLLTRLNCIEAKQSIAALENDTLQKISGLENNVTPIDTRVSDMNTTMPVSNNKVYSTENNASAIYNMSKMELINWQIDRDRLLACTNVTEVIDEDTVTKCKTMQLGVRNGQSVSVYTWVIEDYRGKIPKQAETGGQAYNSQSFYRTVPGYKFRLHGSMYSDTDIFIYLQLLPGEYDDQLKWPFSIKYETTVLTNDGNKVVQISFSGEKSECQSDRPSYETESYFYCSTRTNNWHYVRMKEMHILDDGSVVIKLYLYN